MKLEHIRNILLKCSNMQEALNLLSDEDPELRRHLEGLAIIEWENGWNACESNNKKVIL